jgi:aminomethyltransferase
MTTVDGWEVPAAFAGAEAEAGAARAGAGLWDLSARAKWEIVGTVAEAALAAFLGGPAPVVGRAAAAAVSGEGVLALRLAADRALILGPPGMALEGSLRAALPAGCAHLLNVTSGLCGIRLAGPSARAILAALTALELSPHTWPDLSCAQTDLAHIHAILLRHDVAGLPAFEVYAARNYGAYLWEAFLDAGRERGLAPCGLDAERLLEAPTVADPR